MKYTIVSGSTRKNNNQSIKVASFIQQYLLKQKEQVYILDLATANLKYWDESFWVNVATFDENWNIASKEIKNSDALIIIAPEWNGMNTPALINFFHLAVNGELSNKPALLVGISAGSGGTYPIMELKTTSSKNTFINYIPHNVIIRNVANMLNTDTPNDENDKAIQERLIHSLNILTVYAESFITIRKSEIIKQFPYKHGM